MLSFETFAAKDEAGRLRGMFFVVPPRCGLKQADTLRLSGNGLLAVSGTVVLPLDFAELTAEALASLREFVRSGAPVPVAEFTASGLLDAYFVNVAIA